MKRDTVLRAATSPLLWFPMSVGLLLAGFTSISTSQSSQVHSTGSDGPASQGPPMASPEQGDAATGQRVFRFGETPRAQERSREILTELSARVMDRADYPNWELSRRAGGYRISGHP